ncbi:cytochrome P450 [Amycolatopsis suaedae]|uniref:Cytochrome P450 n=1 Tax=Amycolatopsis suaedae TaxID=2510978 RepID=A0A4Q7J5J2_9PSEU|nr:cytochrome P450 [Amycolatopsis suaedae]RZQ62377.1 cytochrome P450 [Amycolatopsis suaedae]
MFTELELLFQRAPEHPFRLPEAIRRLRDTPMVPMRYPDGHVGWLVTGHEESRTLLAHPAMSNRYELMHPPLPGFTEALPPAPVGDFLGLDAPEHTRFRRLLAGKFTARRMRLLTEQVRLVTEERLAVLAEHGPPADLVELYARPIPALVICELLGVPGSDREAFQEAVNKATLHSDDTSADNIMAAWQELQGYLDEHVKAKRANPTDDVLSELTTSDLSHAELTGVGTFLLGAGLHTTASVISMATFALLLHPEQLAAVRDNPELADGAVEELVRYTGIGPVTMRCALEDIRLGEHTVTAGQTVSFSFDAANRDPRRYTDPDELDVRRDAAGHLTFAHGVHQCLGQHLARTELRIALPALLNRFPTLELAVPARDIRMRTDTNVYGIDALPLTWQAGSA